MKKRLERLAGLVFGLLLVMGVVFGGSVLADDNTTISKADLISGLGFARNFGIVANDWTQGDHLEAAVCVQKANFSSGQSFTNTANVYRNGLSYKATVSKTGNVTNNQKFNIALFIKDSNGGYTVNNEKYLKISDSDREISKGTPVTYDLNSSLLSSKQNYYLFELDSTTGNPIAGNNKNGEYTVTYSSDDNKFDSSNANLISALNNTSYIVDFSGSITANPFNDGPDPYIVFGDNITFTHDVNNDWFANSGSNKVFLLKYSSDSSNTSPKYATKFSKDNYPVNFTTLFSALNTYSRQLAALSATEIDSTADVRVISLTATKNGTDDTKADVDQTAWKACKNLNTGEDVVDIAKLKLNSGQYVVINVTVPDKVTNLNYSEKLSINDENGSYSLYGSRVLLNFCRPDGTPYDGDLYISAPAVMGTFLAPSANMELSGGPASASYIANIFKNDCEVHYIPFGVEDSANSNITIGNTTSQTTGNLTIHKVVQGTGAPASDRFKFKVEFSDGGTYDGVKSGDVIELGADETKTINGIPTTVKYTVTETSKANYTADRPSFGGNVTAGQTKEETITNTYARPNIKISKKAVGDGSELAGATLKITDANGKTVQQNETDLTWTSDGKNEWTVTGLEAGTYNLVEETAPAGYKKAESVSFTIDQDGKVTSNALENNVVTMRDALIPTGTVDISGTKSWNDANDKYGLRPASITVYLNANGVKQHFKKVTAADNWSYSFTGLNQYDSQGNTINYSISEGDVEYYTPSTTGYNLVNTLDESFSLVIKKTDRSSAHVGIPGTTYALYRKGAKTDVEVGEYTTGSDGTVTATNLPAGQYYLKETKAPAGYTVDPNPSAVITLGDKNNGNDGNGSETVTDGKIVLNISKQDLANGKELPGATLSIIDATTGVVVRDKDGNDLTWVSGTSPKSIVTSNLEAGKEYLLTEVTAPNGYYVAETIRFKIGEDENSAGTTNVYVWQDSAWTLASNQTVVMKDSNTENPSHPSTTGPTAPNVSPSSANPTGSNPSTPNLTPNNGGGTSTTVPNASNSTTTSTVTGSGSGSSGSSSGNASTGVNGSSLPIAAATLCALGALVITAVYKRRKED